MKGELFIRKMRIGCFIAVILLFVLSTGVFAAGDTDYKLMDVDGDGKITVADARLALRAVAKLDNTTDRCQYAVDIDDDGKLSGTEARAIMRVAAGLADETITIQELCGYYIDQVGIVLKSEYSLCPSKEYEPEYFSDMIERTYNSAYITPDTKEYFADDFQQIIILYLKEPSRDNVKKAIKEIEDKNLIDVDFVDISGFGYIYPA